MATSKPRKRGLMLSVLSRMAGAGESLISDRHAETMLFGLLESAEAITDPVAAWDEVRSELCASWGFEDGPSESRKSFIYADGIAVIPIHGILINRFNYCWGDVTGYDFIRKQKNAAEADPDVKLIVYDHDSPGGEAAGCDEIAREIFAGRAIKPSLALVNTLSASGSFWLAAAATRVICAPSGSVGSIGVYIQLMRIGKMLAEMGAEVEYIKNGKFKTAGNPYGELSDDERAYLQAQVDERAVEFHRAVAEFRGIEESVVKDTQARVMRPTEAIALGLIDAAESPATAVSSFVAELGNDDNPADPGTEEEEMAEMTSEEMATFKGAERARIKGITTHAEAKGRESLASHLAHDTDLSVEAAAAILTASPKAEEVKPVEEAPAETADEKKTREDKEAKEAKDAEEAAALSAPKPKSHFESAMDTGKHPNVGPDKADGGGDEDETQSKVAEILGAQTMAFGTKHKQSAKA